MQSQNPPPVLGPIPPSDSPPIMAESKENAQQILDSGKPWLQEQF